MRDIIQKPSFLRRPPHGSGPAILGLTSEHSAAERPPLRFKWPATTPKDRVFRHRPGRRSGTYELRFDHD
jgi:hypothetical protein